MATLRLYLDDRHLRKDGSASLKLAVSSHGKSAYVNTDIYLPPDCWKDGKVVKGHGLTMPVSMLNAKISSIRSKAELVLEEQGGVKSRKSASRLRDNIIARLNGESALGESSMTIAEAFDLLVDYQKNISTRNATKTVKSFVLNHMKGANAMTLLDIDEDWAEKLKEVLLSKMANNSALSYFQRVKSVYRYAQKKKLIPRGETPFDDIEPIKKKKSRSRALVIEEVRKLWYAEPGELPTEKKVEDFYEGRDMFRLLIGLAGINVKDLYAMTDKDIHEGRLECERSKTGIPISIRIEPEVKEIFEKYKDDKGHLIGRVTNRIKGTRRSVIPQNAATYRINYRLKKLREDLTSYWCRHTWASLCAELDIPDRTISMGLAHAYGNAMDNVYITNRFKKLDAANRKVLDWIQEKGEFASQG